MKKISIYSICLLLVASIFSCSPKLSYMGKDAGESYSVEEFYGDAPAGKNYKVLGIVTNKVDAGDMRQNKLEKIKLQMVALAKKKGADAIVYTSLRREDVGSNGTLNPIHIGNANTTIIKSAITKKNVIEAKLIKY